MLKIRFINKISWLNMRSTANQIIEDLSNNSQLLKLKDLLDR